MREVIYQPHQNITDFLSEMSKYDWVLTVGDMNIHVCCPTGPLAEGFLCLIDALKLTQLVNGPTQAHGHTLGLVLSHSVAVTKVEI